MRDPSPLLSPGGTVHAGYASESDVRTPTIEVARLLAQGNSPVRLRLVDGSEHLGRMRTELLSERSISVFISRSPGDGATIYIDDIAELEPIDATELA